MLVIYSNIDFSEESIFLISIFDFPEVSIFFLIFIFDFPQASIPSSCKCNRQPKMVALLYTSKKATSMAKCQLTTENVYNLRGLRVAAKRFKCGSKLG